MNSQRFENIGWTVGNYCNATCGHCYSWEVRRDSRAFLTHSDIRRVIAQITSLGIKTVNLGGNEPVYTDGPDITSTHLPFIIRTLTEANIPVGLTTNGTSFVYLDRCHHDELMMLNDIDFSLDSPFEAEHDLNRGVKLYRLAVDAVRRCIELGIDCSVITCGMRQNFDREHLSAFLALAKLLGSEFRVNALRPVEESLLAEMPTPEQFYEGFSFLMKNTRCITLGESCLTSFAHAGAKGCPCGTSSFRINGKSDDGTISVSPCVYSHKHRTGDLLTEDITDIVAGPAFQAFANRRRDIPKACRDSQCSFLESCRGGCASRSFFVYGGLEYKDPYCPQEFLDKYGRPDIPELESIGCTHGVRVHDNYLCTWIGSVRPDFKDDYYQTLDQYLSGPRSNGASPICGRKLVPGTARIDGTNGKLSGADSLDKQTARQDP